MIHEGRWSGRQVIPSGWVQQSTTLHVKAADIGNGKGLLGYAYLWWKPSESRRGPEWDGSFLADGNFGQFILCLPAIDTVIVHRRAVTDEFAIARNLGKTKSGPAGGSVSIADFLAIADTIIAART